VYLLQATCCADQTHCCPHGYHCTDTGYCVKVTKWLFMLRSCVMSLSHCVNFTALIAFFKLAGMWFLMINWKTTLCKELLDFSCSYQIWDFCMKCIADNTCSFIHEAYNVISGDVCTVLYTVRLTVVVWTDLVILPLRFAPQTHVLLHHFPSQGTSVCCLNESASSFKTVLISFITTYFCLAKLHAMN
jgi:hypothetical protein